VRDDWGEIDRDFGPSRRAWIQLGHRSRVNWQQGSRLCLRWVRRLRPGLGNPVTRRGAKGYEVRSGGRLVSCQEASTAQKAVLHYVRSLGSREDEIRRVGSDAVAWRGAIFTATLPAAEPSNDTAA